MMKTCWRIFQSKSCLFVQHIIYVSFKYAFNNCIMIIGVFNSQNYLNAYYWYLTSPPASSAFTVKHIRGERLPVHIDAATGRPSGPNSEIFSSYLGTLAREKVSILHASWDQVKESTKKLLWDDILVSSFDLKLFILYMHLSLFSIFKWNLFMYVGTL